MRERRLNAGSATTVTIERCDGDLTVIGWDRPYGQLELDAEENATVGSSDDAITLTIHDDARLCLPTVRQVTIHRADGDVTVRSLTGRVDIESVRADLKLHDVTGDVVVGEGAGDFIATRLRGDCSMTAWKGDATIRDVSGHVVVRTAAGDVVITQVGAATVRQVGGDARLESVRGAALLDGCAGDLTLKEIAGNVAVTGPVGADARIESVAGSLAFHSAGGDLRLMDIRGSVTIAGDVGGDAAVAGVTGKVTLNRIGGDLSATTLGDRLSAATVGGDLSVRDAKGDIAISGAVGGDLDVRNGEGGASARHVGGDASVEAVAGSVHIDAVEGDVTIRRLGRHSGREPDSGTIPAAAGTHLGSVGGDLTLSDVGGSVTCERVSGDATIHGAPDPGQTYTFRRVERATILVAEGSAVGLEVRTEHGVIRCSLPLEERHETGTMLSGRIGQGGGRIALQATDDVTIGSLEAAGAGDTGAFGSLGRVLGESVARTMRAAFADVAASGSAHVQREIDAAMERARRAAERASEKVSRQTARARGGFARGVGDREEWKRMAGAWSNWRGAKSGAHGEWWRASGSGHGPRPWYDRGFRPDIAAAVEQAVEAAMRAARANVDAHTFRQQSQRLEEALRRELRSTFGRDWQETFRKFGRSPWWSAPDDSADAQPGGKPGADTTARSGPASGSEAASGATGSAASATGRPIPVWPPTSQTDGASGAVRAEDASERRRLDILQRLRAGRISVEEAERELDELGRE